MHLQKLVFIAHGWSMAVNNEELVDESFLAWEFGPVAPGLYQALRKFGPNPVTRLIHRGEDTPTPDDDGDVAQSDFAKSEMDIIDQIWTEFKQYQAFQLSALTHKPNSPWDRAYKRGKNSVISNNSIKDYFDVLADAWCQIRKSRVWPMRRS